MNIERDIVPPLRALERERTQLSSRLAVVEAACRQLGAVCREYGHPYPLPDADVTVEMAPAPDAQFLPRPEVATPLLISTPLKVAAPAPEPVKPVLDADVATAGTLESYLPGTAGCTSAQLVGEGDVGPKGDGLTVAEVRSLLSAWKPVISPGNLSLTDIYQAFLKKRCRFSRGLPQTMDLSNPEVLRNFSNHLRHDWCSGYTQFCGMLQSFTGQGALYKMTRDKAEAAIHAAFPEMAKAKSEATFSPRGDDAWA